MDNQIFQCFVCGRQENPANVDGGQVIHDVCADCQRTLNQAREHVNVQHPDPAALTDQGLQIEVLRGVIAGLEIQARNDREEAEEIQFLLDERTDARERAEADQEEITWLNGVVNRLQDEAERARESFLDLVQGIDQRQADRGALAEGGEHEDGGDMEATVAEQERLEARLREENIRTAEAFARLERVVDLFSAGNNPPEDPEAPPPPYPPPEGAPP